MTAQLNAETGLFSRPNRSFLSLWMKDVIIPSLMRWWSWQGPKQGDPGGSLLSSVVSGRGSTFRFANSCIPETWGPEKQRTRHISVQPELESHGGFPGGSDVKESACYAVDLGLMHGWGRSPGEGNGNSFQYSCLENSMDRGAWWAAVHRVAKICTRLSD